MRPRRRRRGEAASRRRRRGDTVTLKVIFCSEHRRKSSGGIAPVSITTFGSHVIPSPLQGMEDTRAVCAKIDAAILSPKARIGPPDGPMNVMLRFANPSGNSGYSDAWPQPGQTASTASRSATSIMSSTFA